MEKLAQKWIEIDLFKDTYPYMKSKNEDIKCPSIHGDGIVFAELDFEGPIFLKAMRDRFGEAQFSPIGYSCYVALTYANELARVAKERKIAVSAALEIISELSTPDGNITFLNREAKLKVIPKMIRAGQVVKLSSN